MNFALQHSHTKRRSSNPRRRGAQSAHPCARGHACLMQSTRRTACALSMRATNQLVRHGLSVLNAHHGGTRCCVPCSSTVCCCGTTAEKWARFTPAGPELAREGQSSKLLGRQAARTRCGAAPTRAFAEEMPVALLVAHRRSRGHFAEVERIPSQYACENTRQLHASRQRNAAPRAQRALPDAYQDAARAGRGSGGPRTRGCGSRCRPT